MVGVGAAIGTGVGLGASILGAIKAGKERRKMDGYLNQQDAENKAWYNNNALSDYTQRADAQNLIKNMRDNMNMYNKRISQTATITGATPESVAAQKEAANKSVSDTYANIGAMGQQWKDNITNQYLNRKYAIANQRMGMMNEKANSYEQLMQNGIGSMGSSADSLLGSLSQTTPSNPSLKYSPITNLPDTELKVNKYL